MKRLPTLTFLLAVTVPLAACSGKSGDPDRLAKAKANFERACAACHSLDVPLGLAKSAEGWKKTVHNMRIKGAALSEAEGDGVAEYLYSIRPVK